MEIEFSVEEADLLAFWEYHFEHSESASATRRRNTYGYAFGYTALGIVLLFIGSIGPGIAFCILGPLWMVYWPRYVRQRYRKQLTALWREGRNPMLEGSQVMRVEGASLVSACAAGTSRIPAQAIQRVVATPDLLLIYTGAVHAFVVPRQRVVRGDIDAFGAELQRLMKAA